MIFQQKRVAFLNSGQTGGVHKDDDKLLIIIIINMMEYFIIH